MFPSAVRREGAQQLGPPDRQQLQPPCGAQAALLSDPHPVGGPTATREDAGRRPQRPPGASVRAVNTIGKFALRVVVLAVIIFAVTRLVDGIDVLGNDQATLGSAGTYLWVALLFAVVNSIVGPVVRLLALPFVMATLGLFLLVVNAALLGLTAALSDRFSVDGFVAALLGGFLIAVFSWIAELLLPLKVRG